MCDALLSLCLVALGVVSGCGGDFPFLDEPRVTSQVQASCWWVDQITLENLIDALVLDRNAGYTAQEEFYAFLVSCVSTCVSGGTDQAICQYNCANCGAALVAEAWR